MSIACHGMLTQTKAPGQSLKPLKPSFRVEQLTDQDMGISMLFFCYFFSIGVVSLFDAM